MCEHGRVAEEIDAVIRRFPWMDFELWELRGNDVVVAGSVDASVPCDVELLFTGVAALWAPMEWRTDTSRTVFELVEHDRGLALSLMFRIEAGHTLFQFVPENLGEGARCVIAAERVECTVKRPPP